MNRYIAEFIGTFALALAVALSLAGKFPVPTAVIAGLTLGVCVYTVGTISGAHLNPSITVALAAIGKIGIRDALCYLVAQFAAGGLAYVVAGMMLHGHPPLTVVDSGAVFAAEALGTFWLGIGVCAVVLGKCPAPASGLAIGGSLLFGITMAAVISNGVLNPAVAVGIGSFSLVYALAPIVGACVAMLLYQAIAVKRVEMFTGWHVPAERPKPRAA
jgi:glycerol uptake facilitator-like aquaporin